MIPPHRCDPLVTHPLMVLRLLSEQELADLARRACGRILAPNQAHMILQPWTQLGPERFEPAFCAEHRNRRTATGWRLCLGVFPAGHSEPVGIQTMRDEDWGAERSVVTASWLIEDWRGRGLGAAARESVLTLAFCTLGAQRAHTRVHPDNAASRRIAARLGYQWSHTAATTVAGATGIREHYTLERADWVPRTYITVSDAASPGCIAPAVPSPTSSAPPVAA